MKSVCMYLSLGPVFLRPLFMRFLSFVTRVRGWLLLPRVVRQPPTPATPARPERPAHARVSRASAACRTLALFRGALRLPLPVSFPSLAACHLPPVLPPSLSTHPLLRRPRSQSMEYDGIARLCFATCLLDTVMNPDSSTASLCSSVRRASPTTAGGQKI